MEYVCPPGTALRESDRVGAVLEKEILSDPAVEGTYRRTGSPEVGYQIEGAHRGEIMAKLKPRTKRRSDAETVLERMRRITDRFEGVVFLHRQPTREKIDESFSGLPAVFGVTLYGEDTGALREAAARVEEFLRECEGVEEVINNTRVLRPEVTVKIDHAALRLYGVAGDGILTALRAALTGKEATSVLREKEKVHVLVHLDTGGEPVEKALRNLLLPSRKRSGEGSVSAAGELVPLSRLASFEVRRVPAALYRLNGRREVTVLCEIEGNLPAVVGEVRRGLEKLELPAGVTWRLSGQYPVLIKTAKDLISTFLLAAFLILTILALQFRSLLLPLAVLASIPLSIGGALLALRLFGQGLDVSVAMGFLTLFGVSVNNGIILVDFRNRGIAKGVEPLEALRAAVSARLRPVLMTSLTTVAALIPSAVSGGAGSKVFQPFSIAVAGGLLVGTAGTLVVLPALLALRSRMTAKVDPPFRPQ